MVWDIDCVFNKFDLNGNASLNFQEKLSVSYAINKPSTIEYCDNDTLESL